MTAPDPLLYLDRIGYRGSLDPTAGTLAALQLAHLRAVPFENLDIHWKRPIVLDVERLFAKIVEAKRGGFCYECNGLFAWLLQRLGFGVTLLSARVTREGGGFGPPFDHLALRVDPPGSATPWLADVGFGDGFEVPLCLDAPGGVQVRGAECYRIAPHPDGLVMERQRPGDASLLPQYLFDLVPRALADFAEMCVFHQSSPASPFTRRRVCSIFTADGRVTLAEGRVIRTRGTTREEEPLPDDAAWMAALRDVFGIEPPALGPASAT